MTHSLIVSTFPIFQSLDVSISMSRLSTTQYLFGCLFLFSVFQSLDVSFSLSSVGRQLRSRRAGTSAAPEQGPSNFALKIQRSRKTWSQNSKNSYSWPLQLLFYFPPVIALGRWSWAGRIAHSRERRLEKRFDVIQQKHNLMSSRKKLFSTLMLSSQFPRPSCFLSEAENLSRYYPPNKR